MAQESFTFRPLLLLALSSVVVRLLFVPIVELLPEEAYYFNYALHLAPGYLDHPPFTAWLIALGTALFGFAETAVRFGAIITSCIAAFFIFKLSALIFDRAVAISALAITALLPYFIGNSFYLSPDAGLVASWSAALYFMVAIVVNGGDSASQTRRWICLGFAIGIGLLSKYTISLLAISGFMVFLLDKKLHFWFRRPAPYVALLIAIILFSPVIYWNASHEWASFLFQSTRRFSEKSKFALFDYIGHILLTGTPIGVLIAIAFTFSSAQQQALGSISKSAVRLLRISFIFPTVLFLISSLQHQPRLNWTGPSFISVIPIFAAHFLGKISFLDTFNPLLRKSWSIFLSISAFGFLGFWTYCSYGLPFIPFKPGMNKLIGWEYLGQKIAEVRSTVRTTSGQDPLIIGMDKHYTAAELAFYMRKAQPLDSPPAIGGRSLFGLDALMFQYWVPAGPLESRPAILVARSKSDLEFPEIARQFGSLEPIQDLQSYRNGKSAGGYFYRLANGFSVK